MTAERDGHVRPAGEGAADDVRPTVDARSSSGVQLGENNVQHNYYWNPGGPRRPLVRRLMRVRDLRDPLVAGVHRPLPAGEAEQPLPPFVARDQTPALVDLMGMSRFILVVGESTAGKTRMAYEAMRARLPGHMFIRPEGKHELAEALDLAEQHPDSVLWLDDLERYLGIDGLTPGTLSPLLAAPGQHTVVLATMRAGQRASYSPQRAMGQPGEEGQALVLAAKVLELAEEVRINRFWTRAEHSRATALRDSRLERALAHADEFGVAQYLAAAPQLFRRWRDAQGADPEGRPRGFALVAAAVDARRAGYHHSLPVDVLRRLHEVYVSGNGGRYVRLESWADALAWATMAEFSTSSLIMPDGEDQYIAFDYLGDAVDRGTPVPEIPARVWEELIALAPATDMIDIAWSAFHRGQRLIAEAALGKAIDAGHHEVALDFAYMMYGSERGEDVLAWLGRALSGDAALPPEQELALRNEVAWWTGARWAGSGDLGKARLLAQGVVDDSTRLLGPEHPVTLASRITFARQVGSLGDTGAALAIAADVTEAAARLGRDDGGGIRESARFEAAVWTRMGGNPRAAIALWQELIAEAVGEQDAGITITFMNIAASADDVADPELDAEILGWLESLYAQLTALDEVRPDAFVELAWILAWWTGGRNDGDGDHARARDIAEIAIEFGTSVYGPDNDEVLTARLVLAHQVGKLGDTARALAISREVAATATRVYGPASHVTIDARKEARRWDGASDCAPAAPDTEWSHGRLY